MKHQHKICIILCLALLLVLSLSGCKKAETITPAEYTDRILFACSDPDNTFPSDLLSVEFLEYKTPAVDGDFRYVFRFENISDRTLTTQILGFYDPALSKYAVPLSEGIQRNETADPIILKSNEGWSFDISKALAETFDSYTAKEQTEITDNGKYLYFEITLDEETYYCILDFENKNVISVLQ